MNFSTILTVLRKELTDHLRDRRTALMVFVSSIAIGPLALFGLTYFISSIEEKAEKKEVYVQDVKNAPQLTNFLARHGFTIKDPKTDYRALIKTGKHDAVLVVPSDFEEKFSSGSAKMELVYDDTRSDSSGASVSVLRNVVRGFNQEITTQRLLARGVSPGLMQVIEIENTNLGTVAQRAAMLLFMIPWIALVVGVTGVIAVAIDMTAGERERGSLEPLLLNPVTRSSIIIGKWLAVGLYAIGIVILILLGFAVMLAFAPLPKISNMVSLSAWQYVGFATMLLPFAPAMGTLQMLIATYGRSFKEAQTYVSYLVLVVSMVPTISMLAQLKDATWQLFVPMLGQLMVLTRILRGDPIEAMHILIPFAVCVIIACFSLLMLTRLMRKESIIFGRS